MLHTIRLAIMDNKKAIAAAIILFAVTCWLFWPSTGYDFLNFDDDRYVAGNQIVHQGLTVQSVQWAFRSIYESYWLPVMWLSYMTDASLFGKEPFGFHATNIILHAANAMLLFLILNAWTKRFWPALFVAALFAWHPARVESVAWISERKDVLSGFFMLLCLLFYRRYSRRPATGREVPAAICMALGLMTKPMLVTLPCLLLLLDYWPLERVGSQWSDWKAKGWGLASEKVIFWALTILFCIMTYYTQTIGSAVHGTDAYPWSERLAAIPVAYAFYLGKTIFPLHLRAIYGNMPISFATVAGSLALLAAISSAVIALGRRCRALPVGWFWFLGLLVPVIGFVRVGVTHVADRFVYLPSIGLAICIAWGAYSLLPQRRWSRVLLGTMSALVLAGCLWQTRANLPHWRNSGSLFEQVLKYSPDHALANNNYGEWLLANGQAPKALNHFQKAVMASPGTTPFIANAGLAMLLMDRPDDAINLVGTALKIQKPDCPFLNFIMGLALIERGSPNDAVPFLKIAVGDSMERPTWRMELVRAYMEAGQSEAAEQELQRIGQSGFAALSNLDGMRIYYYALWQKGHGKRAWSFFERTMNLHTNNVMALNNLAWFLATDPPVTAPRGEALRLALMAHEMARETHPGVLDTLAAAYASEGRFEEAIPWVEKAENMARAAGQEQMAENIDARLRAYRDGKAWGKNGPRE